MSRRAIWLLFIVLTATFLGSLPARSQTADSPTNGRPPSTQAEGVVVVQPPPFDEMAEPPDPLNQQDSASIAPLAAVSLGAVGLLATLGWLLQARRGWLAPEPQVAVATSAQIRGLYPERDEREKSLTPAPRSGTRSD